MAKFPWSQGPTAKFLPQDGIATYRVKYKVRLPEADFFTEHTIEMTARSAEHCHLRVYKFLQGRWNASVNVLSVTLLSDEMALQTGDPVKVVSESEYEKGVEKTMEETKEGLEEQKAKMREKGFWIP